MVTRGDQAKKDFNNIHVLAGATAQSGLTLQKELVITRSKREMRALAGGPKMLKRPISGLAAERVRRIAKPTVPLSPEQTRSKRLTKQQKKDNLRMLKEIRYQEKLEKIKEKLARKEKEAQEK